ncbi:peptidase domain-containing ABC transporter [Chitinophaga sp. LS1]|uniref:peptidase domain-containing ABC transporter n=1 Tax=Chitinophaga sp. LS1 TaxID=3051176 RepID=UPI002AAADC3C|nr:peptidase domain-containing ABC transporter [Chitinophaga sp. LS1]WPV64031.1 peptidase domain-containing ABC transporter [Chitinophaga sp. LS1]
MSFPFYRQLNAMDCGPTCLRMIAKFYGKHYSTDTIRQVSGFSKLGVSLLGISETAEQIGFRTRGIQINYDKLQIVPLPSILHWNQKHFVVLTRITNRYAIIADPAGGMIKYTKNEFLSHWKSNEIEEIGAVGTALILEPTALFYEADGEKENKLSWRLVTQYLRFCRQPLMQVFISLLIGMLLQLIVPFLTQSMVDVGIKSHSIDYIIITLAAQMMLSISSTINSYIRSRIQLRISSIVNLSLLSDFWIKLTKLPLSYFERHHTGDTMQRLGDNKAIQSFLTGGPLSTIFSILTFFIYAIILVYYNAILFMVFMVGNFFYFLWLRIFLPIRRKLNYDSFYISSIENNATLQLVQGMHEIRLNNAEQLKRWEWEDIQARIFKLTFKNLNYSQLQSAGALLINNGKDVLISFMVARLVVEGQLTFGAMLSVQYIIGQLSGPMNQLIGLTQSIQDTKISLERLNEVHEMEDEEPLDKHFIKELPHNKTINIDHLSFRYPGIDNDLVLDDVSFTIPEGKVTAVVGMSGSGKTTILKLLLKIYGEYQGDIRIGDSNFKHISPKSWRRQTGAVLQDGYIFNDTFARNIAVGDEFVDMNKLVKSCKIANILSFIESLPNGFNTRLGVEGVGISQGQKQRLLIARAVYKNPEYLLFDEATNSLDANNEKVIVENLDRFFRGRTVIVVAHRLSTVRDADKIIVIDKGKIIEEGNHYSLIAKEGKYYELVRNQLELGN